MCIISCCLPQAAARLTSTSLKLDGLSVAPKAPTCLLFVILCEKLLMPSVHFFCKDRISRIAWQHSFFLENGLLVIPAKCLA